MLTGDNAVQSKLLYRGYQLEVRRASLRWRVGIYPRTADLPILSRCEIMAPNEREAVGNSKVSCRRRDFLLACCHACESKH
jgi:hypothetical protein